MLDKVLDKLDWRLYALLSAVFAAATAILAKIGVEGLPSNTATAVRTVVILLFAWGIALARGEVAPLLDVSRKTMLFLVLSGIATGLSWLAYFHALKIGPAHRVAAVDKTSLALTTLLAFLVLKEPITLRVGCGIAMMIGGALLTIK